MVPLENADRARAALPLDGDPHIDEPQVVEARPHRITSHGRAQAGADFDA